MVRVKRGVTTQKRHDKILSAAKGYYGRASSNYRVAIERVEKSRQYQYRDRRRMKSEIHQLWIQRIHAFSRQLGNSYSEVLSGLHQNQIQLNRKMLALLAVQEPLSFVSIHSLLG
uniref:Ribosomal protein L20 n=1 Tax=Andalucia godoyi TaxID=505711 RepID=M4Q9C8_ANDGO|nr:ribosomal protein L20 [Andalucia godoyi]AGH24022.1 ribosomal protein L20 [Andalucia godoyi]